MSKGLLEPVIRLKWSPGGPLQPSGRMVHPNVRQDASASVLATRALSIRVLEKGRPTALLSFQVGGCGRRDCGASVLFRQTA